MKMMKWLMPLAAAGMFSVVSVAQAQDTITLRWADQFPLTHDGSKLSAQAFMDLLEKEGGGRLKIQHFPAEQLAKGRGMLDAVKSGVTDIALVVTAYVADKLPRTTAIELPGLFTDTVKASAAFNRLVDSHLLEQEYLPHGVRPLFMAVTPPYQLMTTEKLNVTNLSDISGLKLRVAGSTGEIIGQAIGAVPVRMSAADIYLGVQRGTVDGAIFNAPSALAYKLDEVLGMVTTNASLGAVSLGVFINEDVWQGLPADVQKLVADLGERTGIIYAQGSVKVTTEAYEKLAAAGIDVVELPENVTRDMTAALAPVTEAWVAQMNGRDIAAEKTLATLKGYLAEE